TRSEDERDRQIPSDPENKTQELTWELDALRQEQALRTTLPEEVHRAESLERERTSRIRGADTILERLSDELEVRSLMDQREHDTRKDLPEWFAPTEHLWKPETPEAWATQIQQYRTVVKRDFTRVGAELAQDPPAWLTDLGPVPRRSDRHRDWCELAAEIAAYRRTYNIPDSEPRLVPKDHRKNQIALDLRARATSLHKHSSLTTRPPLSPEERTVDRLEAELAAPGTSLTAAEVAIAELRRRRAGQGQPGPVPFTEQEPGKEAVPAGPLPDDEEGGPRTLRERLARLQDPNPRKARGSRRHDGPGGGPESEGPRLG
ncbi:MAG: hypothetical protein WCC45_01775, partial [Paeniglutamicibacter sp.]